MSLVSVPDAPTARDTSSYSADYPGEFYTLSPGDRATRPFKSLAVGLSLGIGGLGLELATPLNSKFNIRTTASALSYTTSFIVDTIPIDGTVHLSNVNASIDWFPTARNFHISPGVTLYNNTNYRAVVDIPGRQLITLNGETYTSDPEDPIRGTAFIKFGNKVAPRIAVGWGNVIRHHTANFTFPIEFGVERTAAPTVAFYFNGSSCNSRGGNCDAIANDPDTEANILEQQKEIVDDLRPLRFFPILTFGVSYKFGH